MWKLRNMVVEDEGESLLDNLSNIWNHFYKELLPALQVIFCGVLPVSAYFIYSNLSGVYKVITMSEFVMMPTEPCQQFNFTVSLVWYMGVCLCTVNYR